MFSRKWRRYERARWTMGVAMVFVLALPLGVAGLLDAVTTGLYTNEAADVNEKARQKIAPTIE